MSYDDIITHVYDVPVVPEAKGVTAVQVVESSELWNVKGSRKTHEQLNKELVLA